MDQLWAPWRMELIQKGEPQGGCIFCDLPRKTNDRENLILGRTANTFAILNKYPYNNGHLMVVPRTHTGDLHGLPEAEWQELNTMLRAALKIVQDAYKPHGANVGINLGRVAGAGIADHAHWHVVPRWNGDTNFMPVLGLTKVMIEHLYESWDRLRPAFAKDYRMPGSAEVTSW
jgi:ATP adenylyltransferase